MKRRTFFSWLGLGSAIGLLSNDRRNPMRLAVRSNSGKFYVSPDGNDTWSGTIAKADRSKGDGPFATISRARDAIRELKRQQGGSLDRNITVFLRGGTYYLSEPLTLTAEDSGTEAFPITYKAYRNEKPIISGGRPIGGWRRQGNIWVAQIPEVQAGQWNFRYLRVGDRWATRARYPNIDPSQPYTSGFLLVRETKTDAQGKINLLRTDSNKLPNWSNWEDAEIHIYYGPAYSWYHGIVGVTGVDAANGGLMGNFSVPLDIQVGARFFIENVKEALDSPDEWYLNKKTGELFYWATDDRFPDLEIVAPILPRLVSLDNVAYLNVEGITFSDCDTFRQGGWSTVGTIETNRMTHCIIENCTFTYLGNNAIVLENASNYNSIVTNLFTHLGESGIYLGQNARDRSQHCNSNSIIANEVSDIGKVHKLGFGITLGNANQCRVAHNYLHDIPCRGIQLGSASPEIHSHDNVVEYNHIVNSNLENTDSGAIYISGSSVLDQNNIIRYNAIENSAGVDTDSQGNFLSTATHGIYLDNNTSGITVFGNIIDRASHTGIYINGGRNNAIENNIIINSAQTQLHVSRRNNEAGEALTTNNLFRRNILANNIRAAKLVVVFGWEDLEKGFPFSEIDYNLYWVDGEANLPSAEDKFTPFSYFINWVGHDLDRHTIISDPKFVDSKLENYQLQSDSPALTIGFQQIPMEKIGIEGFD